MPSSASNVQKTGKNYKFEQLTKRAGPFLSGGPGAWGQLGDKLVKRLNVPVLFYCTAFGGSNFNMNYGVLKGIPFEHPFVKYADRQPYRPLEKVLTDYVPKTGVWAVLTEHGYNDVAFPVSQFLQEFNFVIDYTRNQFGHPDLPFVIVQEKTTGQSDRLGSAAIGNALKTLISTKANVWKGPDFNAGYWGTPGFHDTSSHLTMAGNAQFASDWDASLTASFFTQSVPVLAKADITATDSGVIVQQSPLVKSEEINYLLCALATLFAFGLLSQRYRTKSIVALLVLAMVYIYRERA